MGWGGFDSFVGGVKDAISSTADQVRDAAKKTAAGTQDLVGSVSRVARNPANLLAHTNPLTLGYGLTRDLAVRIRDDQKDQATGAAEKDAQRIETERAAALAADSEQNQALDQQAGWLRRRRQMQLVGGRSDTLLTGPLGLPGAAPGQLRTLLGG